jgi:phosphatidylinositol alpha-1,6-mannosyltransferase
MEASMVLFAYEFPPGSGGIARQCTEISAAYWKEKRDLRVLTQRHETADPMSESVVVRVPAQRPRREWTAFQWLRRQPSDVAVICGLWYPEGLIALLSGIRQRVVLAHGAELFPPIQRWRRPLWAILQKWVLESAKLVVANSEYTRNLVLSVAPGARVQAIPLAVDHERFAPGDREEAKQLLGLAGKTVICTVSRICPYKGHEVVLRAISQLSGEERASLTYIVAGTGPHERELKRLTLQLGLDSNVRWLGFVPEKHLSLVYRASDLFALCTQELPAVRAVEGFGLVFLEAQGCGTPAVGTRTGGIGEALKDGDGGWLLEENDSRALANLLRQIITSPESAHTAGIRARERVLREFTWTLYLSRFSGAIDRALQPDDSQ